MPFGKGLRMVCNCPRADFHQKHQRHNHRSVTLAQGLLLDVEAGTHDLLGNRFNGK